MNATVKDVMTTDVFWVRQDATYETIAAALRQHHVSAFPVLDDVEKVIGIVSESDMLAKLALGISDEGHPGIIGILPRHQLEKAWASTAQDLMTSPAYTVSPEDTVEQAARIMYRRNVKRLPVVDAVGRLAGIVSRTDLLAVFSRTDADIAEEIRTAVFAGQDHFAHRPYDVSVQSGIVTIFGAPLTIEQARRIAREARHIQGVVAVRDRLDYPVPEPRRFDVLARFPVD
jgi:CBS domain-containing protein